MTPGTNPRCWANHLGLAAIEPGFFRAAVAAVKAGTWAPAPRAWDDDASGSAEREPTYAILADGVAALRVDGPLMKPWSKFGGTSTVWARQQIRKAVEDPKVSSILLVVDSPGGYVAGTEDLAEDVRKANEQKPVVAYIEDLGASAAYWIASQAGKVFANPGAFVGSIGVLLVVEDSSKAAELAGVQVHVIATGPLKGAGAEGVPISDEMLDAWQVQVDDTMARFGAAVRRGRGMSAAQLAAASTGGTWIASKAKDLGLLDGVKPLDAVLASMPKARRPRAAAAEVRIRLADAE